jgi:heterodisulfide reductase subunit A
VDVPQVRDYAASLPDVIVADMNMFTCSQDTQEKIKDCIDTYDLNRVVVASCTPRTHEPLFRETLREAGLNKYVFEMANIRDQCSWVHMGEPDRATEKAKDLVRSAVAKVRLVQPLAELRVPVNHDGLVIGGGIAGMVSALALAEQGFKTHLVERQSALGGQGLRLHTTHGGAPVQPYLQELERQVTEHPLIDLHLDSTVQEASGVVGDFTSTVRDREGHQTDLKHGAVILATGGKAYEPTEYLYGEDPNVLLSLELDEELMHGGSRFEHMHTAVFIQCVGSRTPERPYCSKVCCAHSIQNALALKEINPDMDVYILYRDIRTYGEREHLYREARKRGVLFIRYDPEAPPTVVKEDQRLKVTVNEHVLERAVDIYPDMITLATAVVPYNNEGLARLYKASIDQEGFFLEAHMKLRPVDSATDGVFLAGLCHYPKPVEEAVSQAKAASARAAVLLSKEALEMEPIVSVVDQDKCNGCGICERVCPYGAIYLVTMNGFLKAQTTPVSCKGCGLCAAACPSKAVDMCHFGQAQIRAQVCGLAAEPVDERFQDVRAV